MNQNPKSGWRAGGGLSVQYSPGNPKAANVLDNQGYLRVAISPNDQDNLTGVDVRNGLPRLRVANDLNAPPPSGLLHRRLRTCLPMSPSVTAKPMPPRLGRSKTQTMPSACL